MPAVARRPPMRGRLAPPLRRQQGSVVLFFALFLIPLLMFGAFAISLARVSVVRNELQNAADAAALAGASVLIATNAGTPAWAAATTAANSAVALNASDNTQLSSATVTTGYWNLAGSPSTLQPTTITPGANDASALQVTVTRGANQNGGPISLPFGALLGLASTDASATAVAVTSAPSTVAGGLLPVAMAQCMYDAFWNTSTNQPTIDPATGVAYEFQIGNGQPYITPSGISCESSQWTSFLSVANDVPTIRGLITNGNPTPVSIGDNIYIQPGDKTTLYSSIPTHVVVYVPIVSNVTTGFAPIVAFAAFYIDASVGGSGKYIQGHFLTGYTIPQSSGVGPYYGAYVPPRLAF
ncbi:MAG: pilus assembly protein TadE [Herbaspirillum sp.]|jgi:Flp pilus assembly protein TadG|nr:pilus assembly protein TadE [Herbaspirillum sp.]